MPLSHLFQDPNFPGLRVCIKDLDVLDPYRLPAPLAEAINLPFARPDEPLDGFYVPPPSPEGLVGWMGVHGVGAIGLGWYGV